MITPKKPSEVMKDEEIITTLQLAYRWGHPLMAMTINNKEIYGSVTNAFYHMKAAADDKSQRDRGFNAETLYSAGALDLIDIGCAEIGGWSHSCFNDSAEWMDLYCIGTTNLVICRE